MGEDAWARILALVALLEEAGEVPPGSVTRMREGGAVGEQADEPAADARDENEKEGE